MTQCHSGGFHELGVAREPIAPAEWFVALPPSFASTKAPPVPLRAAGFTATDLESPAAGCVADPDPERWAGYERFLPERLFGRDLLSGRAIAPPTPSFALAHEAATLVDRTIDKPRATSEHFLETWAGLIETKLVATAPLLTPRVEQAVAAFRRTVDTGRVGVDDPALRARQAQFDRFTLQLAADVPSAKDLLVSGRRSELDAALRGRGERGAGRGGRRGGMTELRRAWTETLRPAWKAAVLAGRVEQPAGAVLAFEKHLLKLEDDGRDFFFPRGDALMNELFWQSGYAEPATLDPAKASAMARWAAERRMRIVSWARASADAAVRTAAEKIGPGVSSEPEAARPMARRTAVERVLFYRRVLGAWEFLIRAGAQPQLAQLHALIELERTPLRTHKL